MSAFWDGRDPDPLPASWRSYRLKDVAPYVNRGVAPDYADEATAIRVFNQKCVRPDRSVDLSLGRYNQEDAAKLAGRALLKPGDVVVNSTGTGTLGRAALVPPLEGAVLADGHVTIVRADPAVVLPRYLAYLLGTDLFYQYANEVLAVGATNQTELNRDRLRALPLALPPLPTQHALVRMLEDACRQLDLLALEISDQLRLLDEHLLAFEDEAIRRLAPSSGASAALDALPRLKHRVRRVTVGIVVTPSKWYAETGAPALRGLNVRPGRVSKDDLVRITEEGNEENAKSQLRAGDVVVVRTGNAGAAAVVPNWAVGGNAIDLLLVRPGPEVLPAYLELLLNSRLVQDQVTRGSVGALQAHFNTAALKNVRVVVPSVAEQQKAVERVEETRAAVSTVRQELEKQSRLLTEHRKALVTSAVTGTTTFVEDDA